LSRKEKEELVRLLGEGRSTREMAEEAHMSLRDIGVISRRLSGEEEERDESTASANRCSSLSSRAFKLFEEGRGLVKVSIALDLEADDVLEIHNGYMRLSGMDRLVALYREMGNKDFLLLDQLYRNLRLEGLANENDILDLVQTNGNLKRLNREYEETASCIGRMNNELFLLKNEKEDLVRSCERYDALLSKKMQRYEGYIVGHEK
jgi:hypothetical protein